MTSAATSMKTLGHLLVLLTTATFVTACSTTPDNASASAAADPAENVGHLTTAEVRKDPDRLICRRQQPTGSRISEKICMTAREWQRISDDGQRVLDTATRAPQSYEDQ